VKNFAPSFRQGCESSETFAARNEKWIVPAILAGFLAVCLRAIHNHGWQGQDFATVHFKYTRLLLANPQFWFYRSVTDRPMLYWIGGACLKFADGENGFRLASVVFSIAGAVALLLMHAASRSFIRSPLLRCSALALIAFLPVTIVTTVVYAADTVGLLPFALGGWSLVKALEAATDGKTLGYAALAGLALSVGNYCKATFLIIPLAVLASVAIFLLWKKITPPRAVFILLLCSLAPALVGTWLALECKRELSNVPSVQKLDWHGTGEMTWRSVLWPYPGDRRIFAAPGYWDKAPDVSPAGPGPNNYSDLALLRSNSFSYPALLHLAIFTDLYGYTNIDRAASGEHRPEPQKTEARLAVCWGLFFSLPTVVAILAFSLQLGRACLRRTPPPAPSLAVWFLFALLWSVPLVAILPYVLAAYYAGYWTPRLVLPALWCFFLMLFAATDALPPRWSRPAAGLLALLVAIQTSLDITSIWF
jgi:hypothetical protein